MVPSVQNMGNSFLFLEKPFWWLFIAAMIAAIVALIPYLYVNYPWKKGLTLVLFFLRFAGIFLLLVLLLNPLLRRVANLIDPPAIAVVYDNSISVKKMTDSLALEILTDELRQIETELNSRDQEMYFQTLDGTSDLSAVNYEQEQSNLTQAIRAALDEFEGKNLAGMVLITDGIYNQGVSPSYLNYPKPVITLGLGDTLSPKDLSILSIKSNTIAYQGNKFPVEVVIQDKGYEQVPKTLSLMKNGEIIAQRQLYQERKVSFQVDASETGLNRITAYLAEKEGEISKENNRSDIYVDVIEGRERILIVAPSPHPDIHAVRKALDQASNFETELYIPSISKTVPSGEYDVVIEHQAFSRAFPSLNLQGNPSKWYILGPGSQTTGLSSSTGLDIVRKGNQKDQVKAAFNPVFSSFDVDREQTDLFADFTPITVPFGDYTTVGPVQTLIFQQVGNLVTNRPLLSIFDDGTTKSAFLAGTGIWKWRILEGIENSTSGGFDEIVNKLIQFLSIKADKRKFRFRPVKTDFSKNETVVFNVELYNDIYERVYGEKVDLTLIDENNNRTAYEYFPSQGDNGFELGLLQEGIYKFQAVSSTGGRENRVEGDFLVQNTNVESQILTANHQLLREISEKSNGAFLTISNVEELGNQIEKLNAKGIVRSKETFSPFIKNPWILALIVFLFASEWFLRKYFGAY